MPRATSIAIVTLTTIAIGAAGALGAAHEVRPATHFAGSLVPVSPSPSPSLTPSPSPTSPPEVLPGSAQVVAPSTNVLWVLLDHDALFLSTDKGNTWAKRSLPSSFGIRPVISFVNDREGWLLAPGSPATQCSEATADVWHTSDGAATWQHLSISGIDNHQCKDGIWFVDAKHGFVAAADPNHPPTVYRTADGGATWTATSLPDAPYWKGSPAGNELSVGWIRSFGPALYLEASDDKTDPAASHQFLYTSADGAAWTWKMKLPPRLPVMVSETRLLLLTGPDQPQESVNGGQQWHPYQTDLVVDSTDPGDARVVFADAQVGYETEVGAMQRTDDGGAHWVRIAITLAAPAAPPPCTPVASGARVSGWVAYTDAQYGFTISYPRNYAFERAGRGNPDIGWLAVYRAVDTCYLGGYPPGQVEVNVLIKPDAATLSEFVTKHAKGTCSGAGGLFYGVTNLQSVTAAGRGAVTFDEVGTCPEGPNLVHSTVLILKSGYGLELDWWSVDPKLTASLQEIAQQMLGSLSSWVQSPP